MLKACPLAGIKTEVKFDPSNDGRRSMTLFRLITSPLSGDVYSGMSSNVNLISDPVGDSLMYDSETNGPSPECSKYRYVTFNGHTKLAVPFATSIDEPIEVNPLFTRCRRPFWYRLSL